MLIKLSITTKHCRRTFMKDLKTGDKSAITVNNKSTQIINRNGFNGSIRTNAIPN